MLRRREAGIEGTAAGAALLRVQEPDWAEARNSEKKVGRFAARLEVPQVR